MTLKRHVVVVAGLLVLCASAIGIVTHGGRLIVPNPEHAALRALAPRSTKRSSGAKPSCRRAGGRIRCLDCPSSRRRDGARARAHRCRRSRLARRLSRRAQSRSWEGMIAVGDAFMRIGGSAGTPGGARMNARDAYLIALIRARRHRSVDGALRSADAFGSSAIAPSSSNAFTSPRSSRRGMTTRSRGSARHGNAGRRRRRPRDPEGVGHVITGDEHDTVRARAVSLPRIADRPSTRHAARLLAVASIAPLVAYFWARPESRGSVLLIGADLCWTLDVLPDYIVALGVIVVWNIAAIGPSAASLSGFASPVWFLLLGSSPSAEGWPDRASSADRVRAVDAVSGDVPRPGRRILVGGLGDDTFFRSTVARCALTAPLARQVAELLGYPARSRAAVGIGLAAFAGSGLLSRVFLSGATLNLIAWSLLPPAARPGWWMWAMLPRRCCWSSWSVC